MKRLTLRSRLPLVPMVFMLAGALPQFSPAQPPGDAPRWDVPSVDAAATKAVIQRNIFLADRSRLDNAIQEAQRPRDPSPPPAEPAAPSPPPPPDPDAARVLVGVAVIDGQVTAFIEDRNAQRIDRVTKPGPFAQGRIDSISLVGLEYVVDDEPPRTIRLRQALSGAIPNANQAGRTNGQTASGVSNTTTSNTGQSTANAPDITGLSPLERMRLRRLQEAQPSNESAP